MKDGTTYEGALQVLVMHPDERRELCSRRDRRLRSQNLAKWEEVRRRISRWRVPRSWSVDLFQFYSDVSRDVEEQQVTRCVRV